MKRDDCARSGCGHSKEAHHRRTTMRPPADGGAIPEARAAYGMCLASWCDCHRYKRPEDGTDA